MELSSFKKNETRQTEAVARGHRAPGVAAGLEGCAGDGLSWQLAFTRRRGAGRVGLEGRGGSGDAGGRPRVSSQRSGGRRAFSSL